MFKSDTNEFVYLQNMDKKFRIKTVFNSLKVDTELMVVGVTIRLFVKFSGNCFKSDTNKFADKKNKNNIQLDLSKRFFEKVDF